MGESLEIMSFRPFLFKGSIIMFRTAPIIRDPTPAKTIRPGIVNNFFIPRVLVDGIISEGKPVAQKAVPTVEPVKAFATRGVVGVRRIPG